uniref:ATP-dependent Clp protease proteolytic subunit n=1 Tax=Sagittaria trifolia TaxID=63789 RepID=A0A513U1J4_9LILI|nr:clp protease proteolytic subunit [Sagittaria trifolia]QDG01499.1 clp protease proteolytic subunit [Sagittaria trifolia]
MPVGVPKVPFRIPGDEEATWVDLNRLYRDRFLFLGQEVKDEIANQIVGLMTYLNIEDPTRDQFLFINSPGGYVLPGIGIYDSIQFVAPPVSTICIGVAASMASFILLGGEITRRIAFPHARVMMHQPASTFFKAKTGELIMDSDEIMDIRNMILRVYAQRTGKPAWVIAHDIERDLFMSATEAEYYGIVDLVGLDIWDML